MELDLSGSDKANEKGFEDCEDIGSDDEPEINFGSHID